MFKPGMYQIIETGRLVWLNDFEYLAYYADNYEFTQCRQQYEYYTMPPGNSLEVRRIRSAKHKFDFDMKSFKGLVSIYQIHRFKY